jgi:hypothetical protein
MRIARYPDRSCTEHLLFRKATTAETRRFPAIAVPEGSRVPAHVALLTRREVDAGTDSDESLGRERVGQED